MTDPTDDRSIPPPPPPPSGGSRPDSGPPDSVPPPPGPEGPPSRPAAGPGPENGKQGLSPAAWVALGCGCLAVALVVLVLVAGGILLGKIGLWIAELSGDPMVIAEKVVELHPDYELVTTDEGASRLEIRNKKTGDTYWLDASEIAEGRLRYGKNDEQRTLSLEGEGGKGTVRLEGPEGERTLSFEGEGKKGIVRVTGPEGERTLRLGAGAGGEVPGWLPVPEQAEITEGVFSLDTPEGRSGSLAFFVDATVDEVVAFYTRELGQAGWEVSPATFSTSVGEGAQLSADSPDGRRSLELVLGRREGRTLVAVLHSGSATP